MGHGSNAADGMAHADLSGGPSFLGGATPYCAWAGEGVACPTNDGGRASVLRYDTPAIGPASIAISTGNDDYWDVKLTISGSMGDAGYNLRIGHIGERDSTVTTDMTTATADLHGMDALAAANAAFMPETAYDDSTTNTDIDDAIDTFNMENENVMVERLVGGDDDPVAQSAYRVTTITPASREEVMAGDVTTASAAFSFGQGTSVALAWSQDNGADNDYQYIKLDHSYGDGSSVAVYYKTAEQAGVDGSMVGVALGHTIGGGATAFAGYRRLSQDNAERCRPHRRRTARGVQLST